jgi:hypothetical protein
MQYMAFGVTLNLGTTVTASTTNTVKYEIDRTGEDLTNPVLTFWAYTKGASLQVPNSGNSGNGTGGLELHVWDMDGEGGVG